MSPNQREESNSQTIKSNDSNHHNNMTKQFSFVNGANQQHAQNHTNNDTKPIKDDSFSFVKRSDVPKAIVSFLKKNSASSEPSVVTSKSDNDQKKQQIPADNNDIPSKPSSKTSNYSQDLEKARQPLHDNDDDDERIRRMVNLQNERLNNLGRTIKITRPLKGPSNAGSSNNGNLSFVSPTNNDNHKRTPTKNEIINENKNVLSKRRKERERSVSPRRYDCDRGSRSAYPSEKRNRSSSPYRYSSNRSPSPRSRRKRSPSPYRYYSRSPSPLLFSPSPIYDGPPPPPVRYYSISPPPRRIYIRTPSPASSFDSLLSPSRRYYSRSPSPPRRRYYSRSPSPPRRRRYSRSSSSPSRSYDRYASPTRYRSRSPVSNYRKRSPSPYYKKRNRSPSPKRKRDTATTPTSTKSITRRKASLTEVSNKVVDGQSNSSSGPYVKQEAIKNTSAEKISAKNDSITKVAPSSLPKKFTSTGIPYHSAPDTKYSNIPTPATELKITEKSQKSDNKSTGKRHVNNDKRSIDKDSAHKDNVESKSNNKRDADRNNVDKNNANMKIADKKNADKKNVDEKSIDVVHEKGNNCVHQNYFSWKNYPFLQSSLPLQTLVQFRSV